MLDGQQQLSHLHFTLFLELLQSIEAGRVAKDEPEGRPKNIKTRRPIEESRKMRFMLLSLLLFLQFQSASDIYLCFSTMA